MATIAPFAAWRYNPQAVGSIDAVVAPPYDVIGPDERRALAERHPCNVVRLILPDQLAASGSDRYAQAARMFAEWRSTGVLVRDAEPALYVYDQEFTTPGGKRLARRGPCRHRGTNRGRPRRAP